MNDDNEFTYEKRDYESYILVYFNTRKYHIVPLEWISLPYIKAQKSPNRDFKQRRLLR